jgi:7-cyano-7-deazaguanine synthase in queuosine biosynthesis
MTQIVRYVGKKACDSDEYKTLLTDQSTCVVDRLSAERNVTMQFTIDRKPLHVPMAAEVRDFIDLAMCVYIGDEVVERKTAGDGWTRTFPVLVPVREPDRWNAISDRLSRSLRFLAQDRFQFTFCERTGLPSQRQHRRSVPRGYDTVCLFSGGIDSLLGAHRLLSEGRKVLLVGHQADPITASAQKDLAAALRLKFPGQLCLIQCRVARSKTRQPTFQLPSKVEESHRPRSFLFLAIAVAIARAAKSTYIYMPENGLIALNPPLQISRVGSHSTRTAHPVFLTRLVESLHGGGIFTGTIRNPFLYESKSDMLRTLDPSLIDLVKRSVSCSHPSRYQDEGVRHCGYCVPCLYRRTAMMVCGLDRESDYAFDVWRDRRSLLQNRELTTYAQADARAMVPFAKRVVAATDAELELLVLFHGYFPPDAGGQIGPFETDDYSPWTKMMRRWAQEFLIETPPRSTRSRMRMLGLTQAKVPSK